MLNAIKDYWVIIIAVVSMIGWCYTVNERVSVLEQTTALHTIKLATYDTTLTQIQIELAKLNANVELLIKGKIIN